MSVLRTASENGQSRAVGSARRATGAAADSPRGVETLAQRCQFPASSPEGSVFAARGEKGFCRFWPSASRAPGRALLAGLGALTGNIPSTANKSLKYVPALRASTGRS